MLYYSCSMASSLSSSDFRTLSLSLISFCLTSLYLSLILWTQTRTRRRTQRRTRTRTRTRTRVHLARAHDRAPQKCDRTCTRNLCEPSSVKCEIYELSLARAWGEVNILSLTQLDQIGPNHQIPTQIYKKNTISVIILPMFTKICHIYL